LQRFQRLLSKDFKSKRHSSGKGKGYKQTKKPVKEPTKKLTKEPTKTPEPMPETQTDSGTYTHQGRENIASCPLKIIAISIIFCGNFPIKIATVTMHFPQILVLKIFTPAQVFFFSTIFFLIKTLHLHCNTVHFTFGRLNLTFRAPHLTAIIFHLK
jgi:hypothetical protein